MELDYDSILTAQDTNVINTNSYYKIGRGLPDHGIPMVEQSYSASKDDILIAGGLILFLIMALIVYYRRANMLHRLKDFFSSKRTYSEENVNENSSSIYSVFFLMSIIALSLSLVLFDYIAKKEGFSTVLGIPYWIFAAGYVVLMSFIYIKAWLYTLVNWTFFDYESSKKWITGYMFLTSLMAYLIFPLSVIVVLVEDSREIVTFCFAILFIIYELLLFFKLIVNFETKKYGYLLIFLYFCSVELIPTLIMSRITIWVIDSFIVKNLFY